MTEILSLTLHICVLMLVCFAAYEDVRYLRIRNTIAIAVAVLFIPMLVIMPFSLALTHVITSAVVFAVCVGLYFARVFGGGDAKLLGAVALWPALPQIPAFILVMAFAGGVIALTALVLKRTTLLPKLAAKAGDKSWFGAMARGETVVPYGIAIACAAAVTLF